MKHQRRTFIKWTGQAGLWVGSNRLFKSLPLDLSTTSDTQSITSVSQPMDTSIIGLYGPWAASLTNNKLPAFSFRKKEWTDINAWRQKATERLLTRMAVPSIRGIPKVQVQKQYEYDGLHIEEVSWQLPYGRPTEAIVLKPLQAKGRLPAVLAFHDHSGDKYFGKEKITRTGDDQHPLMVTHQQGYYSGKAWANELAKKGYVVLVPDAFAFGSRRVQLQDVPEPLRHGLSDPVPTDHDAIEKYNHWASDHEHIMAKSLFSAGTTWPGVFFAEDQKALDVLCARADVDADRVGCGGLSGGGIRSVYMGGLDPRIKCAIPVGFMTTWNDLILNKSYTHTWMTYVPFLPNELDFPEILSLRTPLPSLVLNNTEDSLFTLQEMKAADEILAEVYKKVAAADHYKCSYYPGPHKFDAHMQAEAFAWFDKWLNS